MNLSANFTLHELLHSPTARRLNITEQYNPPIEARIALQELCEHILQPLRERLGPLTVNSGYRSPALNKAVKGARNSQHLLGQAADIEGVQCSNADIFKAVQDMNLSFDQLIWEYGTRQEPDWVHVSYGPRHRRQVLYIGV